MEKTRTKLNEGLGSTRFTGAKSDLYKEAAVLISAMFAEPFPSEGVYVPSETEEQLAELKRPYGNFIQFLPRTATAR